MEKNNCFISEVSVLAGISTAVCATITEGSLACGGKHFPIYSVGVVGTCIIFIKDRHIDEK